MTLEEKVGQLFMTHVYGSTADTQDPADVAANQKLYGVDNAAQLIDRYQPRRHHLLRLDQQRAEPRPDRRPVQRHPARRARASGRRCRRWSRIDQEGGIVARIGPPATQLPGNMALGAGRSTATPQTAAAINGDELAAMGINWNFAPVADVNVNPANPVIGVRSFGENPRLVAGMTAAQVARLPGRR